jgi:hypothetical protein
MYDASAEFAAALYGGKALAKCEVLTDGQPVAELRFTTGDVSVEAQRSTRRTMNMTFLPDDVVPDEATDLLFPAGNELKVHRGVVRHDGVEELVPLGVYGFDTVAVTEDQGYTIQVSGFDRAEKVRQNVFTESWPITKGTSLSDAISEILANRVPQFPALSMLASTDATTPLVVYGPGQDPWEACQSLATAAGMQLYFDPDGVPTLNSIPVPSHTTAVLTYDLDDPNGTHPMVTLTRELTTGNTYNGVIASGEGTDLVRPLRAERWDDNPTSPFYYLGEYGKKPFFYSSPLLLTEEQCIDAAQAQLSKLSGAVESASWQGIVDPRLEAYDVFWLKRDRIGVDAAFMIDSLTIPLTAEGSMQAVGRTVVGSV